MEGDSSINLEELNEFIKEAILEAQKKKAQESQCTFVNETLDNIENCEHFPETEIYSHKDGGSSPY